MPEWSPASSRRAGEPAADGEAWRAVRLGVDLEPRQQPLDLERVRSGVPVPAERSASASARLGLLEPALVAQDAAQVDQERRAPGRRRAASPAARRSRFGRRWVARGPRPPAGVPRCREASRGERAVRGGVDPAQLAAVGVGLLEVVADDLVAASPVVAAARSQSAKPTCSCARRRFGISS